MKHCDVVSLDAFRDFRRNWAEDELQLEAPVMEDHRTQNIAVGSK